MDQGSNGRNIKQMSEKRSHKKIVVVGGGAAGCMAAIAACSKGGDVTLIEKNKAVARKILSTGNGKCNYCHDVRSVWMILSRWVSHLLSKTVMYIHIRSRLNPLRKFSQDLLKV